MSHSSAAPSQTSLGVPRGRSSSTTRRVSRRPPLIWAALYASVGRELKSLDQRKGEDATLDLWPRYRWIRINDVLVAAPDKRVDVATMLADLHRDIATR